MAAGSHRYASSSVGRPLRPVEPEGAAQRVLRVVDVLHVEVGDVGGREDDAAALLDERAGELGRVVLGLDEAPVLPDRAGRQLAGGAHLVPADERLAGRGAGLRHPPHQVEVVGLARGERLVAAEVQLGSGRELGDLARDVGEERSVTAARSGEAQSEENPTSVPSYGAGATPSQFSSG